MKTTNYLTSAILISAASAAPLSVFNDESLKALISRVAEPLPMACAISSELDKREPGATKINCALARRGGERDLTPRIAMSCNIVQRNIDTRNPEAEITCARGDADVGDLANTADDTLGGLLGGGKCYIKRDGAGVATLTHCGCKRGDDGACVGNPFCKRGADGACIGNPFCKRGADGACIGNPYCKRGADGACIGDGLGDGYCKRGDDGNCIGDGICKRGDDGNCIDNPICKRGDDGNCVGNPYCKRGDDGNCIGGGDGYCKRGADGNCIGKCKRGDDDCY